MKDRHGPAIEPLCAAGHAGLADMMSECRDAVVGAPHEDVTDQ